MMRLGPTAPFLAPSGLSDEMTDWMAAQLHARLRYAGVRADRAQHMAEWISAASAYGCDPFRVVDLRKTDGPGPTAKQFRNLLDAPGWDPVVLRRLLVAMAP